MKQLIFILTIVFSVSCFAVPKRFKITNQETGLQFAPVKEDGQLGTIQPEWGKPARRILKSAATPFELGRCTEVTVQEDIPDVTGSIKKGNVVYCDVPADYTIVEEDITAELQAAKTKETLRKAALDAIKALKGKTTLTNTERDKVLLFLVDKLSDEN